MSTVSLKRTLSSTFDNEHGQGRQGRNSLDTKISKSSSCEEVAAIVSTALENAGISATLSGGSAVTIYTQNQYQSQDLDFVTAEALERLVPAMASIGFSRAKLSRLSQFEHPNSKWYVDFVSAPLAFGERRVKPEDIPVINTPVGKLRAISATQSVMDRLSAYFAWNDLQCRDQAIAVAQNNSIDWEDLQSWFRSEGHNEEEFQNIRRLSEG